MGPPRNKGGLGDGSPQKIRGVWGDGSPQKQGGSGGMGPPRKIEIESSQQSLTVYRVAARIRIA